MVRTEIAFSGQDRNASAATFKGAGGLRGKPAEGDRRLIRRSSIDIVVRLL
jgi:hypothetical protein